MGADVSDKTKTKWRELVSRLARNTHAHRLSWENGNYEGSIVTTVNDHAISLQLVQRSFETNFIVQIADQFGDIVDTFSDEDVGLLDNGVSAHIVLSEVYRDVKRTISGADAVLDAVISALPEDPDGIPF